MSPEERLAVVNVDARARFRASYQRLRSRNKDLAEKQRQLRLQRKPSRGAVNKDLENTLMLTVILRLMLKVRGKRLTTLQPKKCRCCGHVLSGRLVDIHALPKDSWGKDLAHRFETDLIREFDFAEFIE